MYFLSLSQDTEWELEAIPSGWNGLGVRFWDSQLCSLALCSSHIFFSSHMPRALQTQLLLQTQTLVL